MSAFHTHGRNSAAKKIDLSLTFTEHAQAQPTGALLILDRALTQGSGVYTYQRERTPAGQRLVQSMMADARYRPFLEQKEAEHQRMAAISKNLEQMMAYLDGAPDGLVYEQMAARIRTT